MIAARSSSKRAPRLVSRPGVRRAGVAHADTGERRHQHAVPGDPDAPAEVQIRVREIEAFVPHPRPLPRVARDEHRGRRHAQHLEDAIELSLIDLPRLQRRCGVAEAVRRATDVTQRSWIVLVDDLRADDPHVLDTDPHRRLHQPRHRISIERRGRLEDQDEVRALRHRAVERFAHGVGGPEGSLVAQHAARPQRSVEELPRSLVRVIVDGQHTESRVGLVREGEEAITQPGCGSRPDHDQREHAGCGRAGRRDGCGGWRGHPDGSAEALREPSSGAREHRSGNIEGGRCRPPSRYSELAISASSRRSSCVRACAPRSSCGPWPSCGPACGPRSSCDAPACERRSSCGPWPSCGPACGPRSSCGPWPSSVPACGRWSSCRAAVFLRAGFLAAVFLAAVFLRAGFRGGRLLGCRLPTRRLASRRLLRGGPLPRGCLPCCHSRPPFLRGYRRVLRYDAIRLRRRRSRSLIPPHTPYRSSRRSA